MLREEEWAIEVMPVDSYHAIMAVFLQKWVISSNYPVECLSKRNFYLKKKKNQILFALNQVLFPARQTTRTAFPSHNNSHFWCFTRSLILANSESVIFLMCCVMKSIILKKKASPLLTYTPLFQRPHRCSNYVLYRSLKIPFYSVPPFMWLCPSMSNAKYFHFLSPWFFFPLPPLRFKCRQLWQLNQQRPSVSPASWS